MVRQKRCFAVKRYGNWRRCPWYHGGVYHWTTDTADFAKAYNLSCMKTVLHCCGVRRFDCSINGWIPLIGRRIAVLTVSGIEIVKSQIRVHFLSVLDCYYDWLLSTFLSHLIHDYNPGCYQRSDKLLLTVPCTSLTKARRRRRRISPTYRVEFPWSRSRQTC